MTPCIWFWIAAIVIFIIAEAVTVALVSVWFIGGAVCALLAAIFGAPGLAQAAVFVIVSALLLILVCPLAKKKLKPRPERLNADRLAGQTAIVTEPIDAQLDTGAVRPLRPRRASRSRARIRRSPPSRSRTTSVCTTSSPA